MKDKYVARFEDLETRSSHIAIMTREMGSVKLLASASCSQNLNLGKFMRLHQICLWDGLTVKYSHPTEISLHLKEHFVNSSCRILEQQSWCNLQIGLEVFLTYQTSSNIAWARRRRAGFRGIGCFG